MLIPPAILEVRVGRRRLWLPLVLLWPVLVLAELVLLPVAVVVGVALLPWNVRRGRFVMGAIPAAMHLFAALRGLTVDVRAANGDVVLVRCR